MKARRRQSRQCTQDLHRLSLWTVRLVKFDYLHPSQLQVPMSLIALSSVENGDRRPGVQWSWFRALCSYNCCTITLHICQWYWLLIDCNEVHVLCCNAKEHDRSWVFTSQYIICHNYRDIPAFYIWFTKLGVNAGQGDACSRLVLCPASIPTSLNNDLVTFGRILELHYILNMHHCEPLIH